jgi:RNA polymerase-binding transcription factor DksA
VAKRKAPATQKPDPEARLQEKAKELERVREFIDETSFGADERSLSTGLSVIDQHPADSSDVLFQRELQLTALEIIDEEAAQVQKALQRKAQGLYGVCEECEKQIAPERLAARPNATLCIECQRKREGRRAA